jgi:hypothetical protein
MRLAYIILAHKLPDLLVRLVHRLQSENAIFLVHVDKKTSRSVFERMRSGLKGFDNVYFLDRLKCYYSYFGHVEATLRGIEELLALDVSFSHAVLLRGQDYPLKPNSEIESFFARNEGLSFIAHTPWFPSTKWGEDIVMHRVDRRHHHFLGKSFTLPLDATGGKLVPVKRLVNLLIPAKREFLPGLGPFGGSPYWSLSREVVHYISDYVANNPGFVRFFRSALAPDEVFFQTLLLNSAFRDKLVNDNLRYTDWSRNRERPAILREDDLGALCSSGKLYATKFDPTVDSHILDIVDRHLLQWFSKPCAGISISLSQGALKK